MIGGYGMAAYSFEYRTPGLYKASAEVAGAVMMELSESEAGLTPATLLDASRDENAPLHNEFEWRDDVAAEKYRLTQAQGLIRNVRIVVTKEDGNEIRERSFVITPGRQSMYKPLDQVLTNDVWRDHLLKLAKEELEKFKAKYKRLNELAEVFAAIDIVLDGSK